MTRSLEGMQLNPIRSVVVSAYHLGRRSGLSKAYPGMKLTRRFLYRAIRKAIAHPMPPG